MILSTFNIRSNTRSSGISLEGEVLTACCNLHFEHSQFAFDKNNWENVHQSGFSSKILFVFFTLSMSFLLDRSDSTLVSITSILIGSKNRFLENLSFSMKREEKNQIRFKIFISTINFDHLIENLVKSSNLVLGFRRKVSSGS